MVTNAEKFLQQQEDLTDCALDVKNGLKTMDTRFISVLKSILRPVASHYSKVSVVAGMHVAKGTFSGNNDSKIDKNASYSYVL